MAGGPLDLAPHPGAVVGRRRRATQRRERNRERDRTSTGP
ncbi:Hypothetical protein CAP_7569 [Chondromyces apiculatus DSM 436]|uniref:Uncharacterized protein n=1 Tax=Chondromyces apiculatus DSM 436 TaxID=1192034 RepID=A0A017T069_9BACT|nr:Hypothetical protein CAP_7569 [Chondromyces apiculatus DSM 436]